MSTTMMPKLSWQNCNRNRPAMRHAFQDSAVEFEPERHEFMNRSDVEGAYPIAYESHPTGRIKLCQASLLKRDILTKPEEEVWSLYGELAFHIV